MAQIVKRVEQKEKQLNQSYVGIVRTGVNSGRGRSTPGRDGRGNIQRNLFSSPTSDDRFEGVNRDHTRKYKMRLKFL